MRTEPDERIVEVVAGEFAIAEHMAGPTSQDRQPYAQRRNRQQKPTRFAPPVLPDQPAAKKSGTISPVSLINTSAVQATTARRVFSCRNNSKATLVNTMAGISSCASMACAKKSGDAANRITAIKAGAPGALRQSSIASRNADSMANDAISSMATRVVRGEHPATLQKAAR